MLKVEGFPIQSSPKCTVVLPRLATGYVRRLRRHGLLVLAPVCLFAAESSVGSLSSKVLEPLNPKRQNPLLPKPFQGIYFHKLGVWYVTVYLVCLRSFRTH